MAKFKRLNVRQKFRIDGYWLDDKSRIQNYVCCVNDLSVKDDDQEIFYYFDSWKDVDSFRIRKGRTDTEFVITKIYPY
ncbi:MAG: hypothetical protein WC476_12085 [Phycisphaerae bacterium]|jgi:hypothetical protein